MTELDVLLELIDDKIVKDSHGNLFVRVDDLKALKRQFDEAKAGEEAEQQTGPKTLAGATALAMKDPKFLALFNKEPTAPVGDDVKPEAEEDKENVAA